MDVLGNVSGPLHKKSIAYDPNDKARVTIKETTLATDVLGNVSGPLHKKSIVYDPNDKARVTIKETTLATDYIGNVNSGQVQGGKGYQTTHWEAKPTNKQELSDNSYTGIANSNTASVNRLNVCNADLNYNKEEIAKGRNPTQTSVKLFNSDINQQARKSEAINSYSAVKTGFNCYNHNMTLTSTKNGLPECDNRLDKRMLSSLKTNPLNIDITA